MRRFVSPSRLAFHGILLVTVGLAGCDIPTGLPEWDTRWVVPAERTRLPVADLLPFDVIDTPQGFLAELPDLEITRSLGDLCPECVPLSGLVVPKPPFTASLAGEIPVSESIVSARVDGGTLRFEVTHGLGFDPLRPGGAGSGYLLIELRSDEGLLARDSIDGRDRAMPSGGTLVRTLTLAPQRIEGAVDVVMTLYSPAGDPVMLDPAATITVAMPLSRVAVRDLRLRVDDEISTEPLVLTLDAIDAAVRDRVRSARIHLEIANPFDLTGDLQLRISNEEIGIVKAVPIVPGDSRVTVDLPRDEIHAILLQPDVVLRVEGPATTPATGTAVEPGQQLDIGVRLELVVASSS